MTVEKITISNEDLKSQKERLTSQKDLQEKLDNGFVMRAAAVNQNRLRARPVGWDERVWLSFSPDAGMVLTR